VIHEVDEVLETLVKREALGGSGVEVVFDAPTKEWASRRNTPTVDVYLYDIREDLHRRASGAYDQRDGAGVLTSRTEPPRYFRLSYLVTAWTQRPEDEHRLLAAMLATFLRHKILPPADLVGSLAEIGLPVLLEVAKPPPEPRQISEVWTALGGELKPSLDAVVTAPMTSEPVLVTAPPPEEGLELRTFGEPGQESLARSRQRTGTADDARDAAAPRAPARGGARR
jgi:hypothetical protein